MKKLHVAVMAIMAIAVSLSAEQFVHAQTLDITENVSLDTNQVITVIVIGGVAGLVKAWQGYDKSVKDFDKILFVQDVRNAILIAIPIALTSAMTTTLNAFGYAMLFFAVVGGVSLYNNSRKPTIPDTATAEEIKRISGTG